MKQVIFVFIFAGLLVGCANIILPSGGEKDTSAPFVENSYPEQNQTNFQGNNIKISFNEHISLKEINEQFYTSPPFEETPNIYYKNKTLLMDWKEGSLKDSTTYIFHFGNSITDYNEGNLLTNHSLQFSTSEILDTLSLSGNIVNALSNDAEKGVFAALYIYNVSNSDSLLYLERPNYISKTNEDGNFNFSNLKNQQYVLFALADEDKNLKFSLAEELVGFYTSIVTPNTPPVNLLLFNELSLADTLTPLATDSLTEYGSLIIDSLPSSHHILEVLKDKKVIQQIDAAKKLAIDSLPSGNYQLRLINDENENGKWDTGNFLEKTLPEPITYYPEEVQLRANWELELIWKQ